MKREDLTIRKYREGDEGGISDLLCEVFDSRKNVDYWKWAFNGNPSGFFANNIWIAEYRGEIGSHSAIVPMRIRVGSNTVLSAQGLDAATYPRYRRMGLFQTLAKKTLDEAAEDGIVMIYRFPGRLSYGGLMKLGHKEVLLIPKHYLVLSLPKALKCGIYWDLMKKMSPRKIGTATKVLWKALKRQGLTTDEVYYVGLVRNTLLLIAGMVSNPLAFINLGYAKTANGVTLRQVDTFDDRIDIFWEKISKEFNIVVERDKYYLNWRYSQDPIHEYSIYVAEVEEKIVGYMVLGCEDDEGRIMDIFAFEDKVFYLLIKRAKEHFKENDMVIIQCWMVYHHRYAKLLRNAGFFSHRWVMYFGSRLESLKGVFLPLIVFVPSPEASKMEADFLDNRNWFIAMGDQA